MRRRRLPRRAAGAWLPAAIPMLLIAGCGDAPRAGAPPPAADPPGAQERGASPPATLEALLAERGYRALPLRRLATGHVAVDGVAGDTPFALIVDTGASHTIVDGERARRFRLVVTERSAEATGVGGGMQSVGTGVLRDVTIGPLRLDSLAVSVLDLGHVNRTLRAQRAGVVDGILGADLLDRREAIFDLGAGRLYLRADAR
jgi:hypothetical protein